ncbi:MAG: sugar transferase [Candidatus Omnitrophota bacterium]
MTFYNKYGKRIFDLLFSIVGLILLSPALLLVALVILCFSGKPIFFSQTRIGREGKEFRLIKFRTMTTAVKKTARHFEPGSTSRITGLGRFLRQSKIDELPQLIHIVKGDMSFVGPRPEVPGYRNFYTGPFEEILKVRPGITDEASIKYRNEEQLLKASDRPEKLYEETILPDKLKMNLAYVTSGISLGRDLTLIYKTLRRLSSSVTGVSGL